MRLKNTTKFPTHFLCRLVSWCCKQVDLPAKQCRQAAFLNWKCWRGTAWSRHFIVRVGRDAAYPYTFQYKKNAPAITHADDIEHLVSLTAHELWHLVQYMHRRRTNEAQNERVALTVLNEFRLHRDELLAEWSDEPAQRKAKPKLSVVDRRAVKVQAALDRWTKKLKLAQTKVKKLKAKARYYERKMAARNG